MKPSSSITAAFINALADMSEVEFKATMKEVRRLRRNNAKVKPPMRAIGPWMVRFRQPPTHETGTLFLDAVIIKVLVRAKLADQETAEKIVRNNWPVVENLTTNEAHEVLVRLANEWCIATNRTLGDLSDTIFYTSQV